MRSTTHLQRIANKLLRSAGIDGPPVDVEDVAEWLNVEVRRESVDTDISGALYRLDQKAVIGVNETHTPERQRFTIAHELAHYLLHSDRVYVDRTYAQLNDDTERASFLRSPRSSNAVDPIEIEANKFAAALLMPRDFVRRHVVDAEPLSADTVEELAQCFEVSNQAMMFRLANLRIPLEPI